MDDQENGVNPEVTEEGSGNPEPTETPSVVQEEVEAD